MLILFLAFIASAVGMPCGIPQVCNCIHDLRLVTCYGKNISKLPTFSNEMKASALFLDIINTNITELPSLKPWSSLEWVTLRGNLHLSCDVMHRDYVYVDCLAQPNVQHDPKVQHDATEDFSEHNNLLELLYALVVIPFGFTFASGYVYYVKRRNATRFTEAEKNRLQQEI